MHEQDMSILRALVPVAWADGEFHDKEKQMLDALLEAFGANDEEKKAVHAYAEKPKKLEDIDLSSLSGGDRRLLLQHAVLLSFVDGTQGKEEVAFLDKLMAHLKIPADEAKPLIDAAAQRAKTHLKLLK
jgi:uncharacterized membrane protein YebE (DUF533 family)